MKIGPQQPKLLALAVCAFITALFVGSLGSVTVYAADGILRVENNSTTQDFVAEGITVRTNAYVCLGSTPLSGFDTLLPTQSQEQSLSNQEYTVRSYNEVVGLGEGAAGTYMSNSVQFAGFVCSGIIPSQVVSTITSVPEDTLITIELTGQTQVTLQAGSVPGVELPIIQALPPQLGLSTGVRINQVDLRESVSAGVGNSNSPVATMCIEDQFTIADDVNEGDYILLPGQYSIERVEGAQELFSCVSETEALVDIIQGDAQLITYVTVDDQTVFSGVQPIITTEQIAAQDNGQGNGGSAQQDQAKQDNSQDQQVAAPQTDQFDTNNQVFALADNLPQGNGLIRSGGSNELLIVAIISTLSVLVITDTLIGKAH